MRFLSIYKSGRPEGVPLTEAKMAELGKLIEDQMKDGVLLATEGCMPSALGAKVRKNGDEFKVTDGPFAEAKELIGGFALLNVTSKQEAITAAQRFLKIVGSGECEIRQLCEAPGEPSLELA